MKKVFRIVNQILVVGNLAVMALYWVRGGLLMKGITSSCFTLLGLANLLYACPAGTQPRKFPVLLTVGLVLSTVADVVLNLWFLPGTVFFVLAHMAYFAANCALHPFRRGDLLPIAGAVAVCLVVTNLPVFRIADAGMRLLVAAYSIVISFMLGKTISNALTHRGTVESLLAVGSTLFWFSDLMLALELFAGGGRMAYTLCLFTYFPGQTLLAHTLYHYVNSQRNK